MTNTDREWQNVLTLGQHEPELGRWLKGREEAYREGDSTRLWTNACRRVYRALSRGQDIGDIRV